MITVRVPTAPLTRATLHGDVSVVASTFLFSRSTAAAARSVCIREPPFLYENAACSLTALTWNGFRTRALRTCLADGATPVAATAQTFIAFKKARSLAIRTALFDRHDVKQRIKQCIPYYNGPDFATDSRARKGVKGQLCGFFEQDPVQRIRKGKNIIGEQFRVRFPQLTCD